MYKEDRTQNCDARTAYTLRRKDDVTSKLKKSPLNIITTN